MLNFGSHMPDTDFHQGPTIPLLVISHNIYCLSLHKRYVRDVYFEKKKFFWKSCSEHRALPRPSNTPSDQIITADQIFIKIFPVVYINPAEVGKFVSILLMSRAVIPAVGIKGA